MQPLYGGAAARPFITHHNALDIDLYLRIAPELYLKRLVVGGLDRVFEINRNFRNEGLSFKHNPEFTMLEFYQAYTDYRGMMDLSAELLKQVAIDATGSPVVEYEGAQIDFSSLRRLSMRDAVIEFWQGADRPTPENVRDPEWLMRQSGKSNAGEALAALFERTAESHLIQPTIIYDFPVEISPLSKNKPDEPAFVERFEIYVAGMEIAQRLHRAQRSTGAAPPFRNATCHARKGRRRSAPDGRRLHSRSLLRHAAGGWRGDRHRPAGDDSHRRALHPRRDSISRCYVPKALSA